MYKKFLPLYYLILLVVLFGIIAYIDHTVRLSAGSAALQPIQGSKTLWASADKVYFQYNCSYLNGLVPLSVDRASIRVYNEIYFSDATTLWSSYFTGCNIPIPVKLDPPADIPSFKVVGADTDLAQDRFGLIGTTIVPSKGTYADKIQKSFRVTGLPDTHFQYISNDIILDAGNVYRYVEEDGTVSLIQGLPTDIKKIEKSDDMHSCLYFFNTSKVYSLCPYATAVADRTRVTEIVGADPLTFHKLSTGDFWVDKNAVFLNQVSIVGASSSDFAPIREGYFFSNGHVYLGASIVTNVASPTDFYPIIGQLTYEDGSCGGDMYWTDGKKVYYHGMSLVADPNNLIFQFSPGLNCVGTGYVWDWKNYFYEGVRIDTIDPSSFRIFKGRFARDKNYVYENGKIMTGNPDQLEKDILSGKLPKISEEDIENY